MTNIEKDKQRSTKHYTKNNDRAARTPVKTSVNSGAPEEPAGGYNIIQIQLLLK